MSQQEDPNNDAIWDLYKQENLAKPQNVSQLMNWTKQTESVRSLRFFEAKKIFKLKSMDDLNIPNDIAAEKLELKEWIADCKEEIICLRSDELQTEDDYEESMETLNIKFDHILSKFNEAKQIIIKRRQERYDAVQQSVQSQQVLLQQTLNTLTTTLIECDIKHDKSAVNKVLTDIPEFTEIEYNGLNIPDLKILKREIQKLQSNHDSRGDSKQLLEFKGISEFKNDDEFQDEYDENNDNNINNGNIHDNNKALRMGMIDENGDEIKQTHIYENSNHSMEILPTTIIPTVITNENSNHSIHSNSGLGLHSLHNLSNLSSSLKIHLTSPKVSSPHLETPKSSLKSPSKKRKKLKRKDFQFMSVIGRGTFGKIMLVKKKEDGTKYAMKILKKTQIIAQQQEDNINQEIKVLKHIRHPFLLRAHYVFQTESKIYLVLDYYRYGDLMSHLKLKKKFNEYETRHIISEVSMAIGCLHGGGIVYRDLKPENLLMDQYGHICLCDFGLCKKIGNGVMNTFCGTPDYLAPEILNRIDYDKNVDWWSFGILLFELIVGIVPFYSSSNM
eukprot:21815_1